MSDFLVEMKGISKSFPGVKALEEVDFSLQSGQVMALLGENGAGKSTLMKIVSGIYQKDAGTIWIHGKEQHDLNPKQAQKLGVAIIHQELNMCAHLTVAENMFLGRELTNKRVLSKRQMNKAAGDILHQLRVDIRPTDIVGHLPVSKQQMVEIAKALSTKARILIMDEPTSALTSKEIEDLFAVIHDLKAQGCGIVYISHRLEELQYIVDHVTIMRDGHYIMDAPFKELPMDKMISHMVGRTIADQFPRVKTKQGKAVFEVQNLNAGPMVRDISFTLHEGEIVGVAGLMGAGRTEMTRAIFGIDPKTDGKLVLDGKVIQIKQPIDAIRQGIVLAPEDRKKDGLCIKQSVRENIALPNLDILCNKLGVVYRKKEREMASKAIDSLKIRLPNADTIAGSLSGGNQQKVVVGKWLARTSRVVIFDEPTRGIDVAAKVEIYNLMNQLKQEGIAVLFVSSEMPEIMGISDRILVMCDGRITGVLNRDETTQDEILTYATQFDKKVTADGSGT